MRHLLTLAAAALLAVGCARNQDETGAAPDQGDATVTATDTSATVQTDSTMGQQPSATDTSFVQQDTTAAGADATMSTDSVGAQGEVQTGDSTATGTWTDSTAAAPSDSGAAGTSDTSADTTAAQ